MSENPLFLKYLKELSLTASTEIQSLCFDPLYNGKSVFGLAPTGSGKTLAFVLPLMLNTDHNNRNIQKIILVPTRELGSQIASVIQQLSKIMTTLDEVNILSSTAFGGSPIANQIKEVNKKPHILIATPGRFLDLLERDVIDVLGIKTLILDEADIMVGMGFSHQVEAIYEKLPRGIQIGLFSATKNERVTHLENALLKNSPHVICDAKNTTENGNNKLSDSQIQHKFVLSNFDHKYDDLVKFLKIFDANNDGKIILFCHRRETSHELAENLKNEGLLADAITGELGQIHRNSIMRNFKNGNLKYLVATNIAARGIDVDKLSAVVHYDVPFTPEDYIHRSGRTGRSGFSEGSSITFCDQKTKGFYLKLMNELKLEYSELKLNSDEISAAENKKIKFVTVHLNKGKRNKIRPGDIVGAFIQELSLEKDDIGSIFIFDNFTHIEINSNKKSDILNKSFKVKNLAVRARMSDVG